MTVYVDSSVLLRVVLGEPGVLREWRRIRRPIASQIIRLECLRTLDRARVRRGLPAGVVAERRSDVIAQLEAFDLIRVDATLLERATEPFPIPLGSLDAIHLTSAQLARLGIPDLAFATHDRELAAAATAVGFPVLGAPRTS